MTGVNSTGHLTVGAISQNRWPASLAFTCYYLADAGPAFLSQLFIALSLNRKYIMIMRWPTEKDFKAGQFWTVYKSHLRFPKLKHNAYWNGYDIINLLHSLIPE